MGEVYLAQDTTLDRQVAVKILNEKFAKHESNLQRFIREAKAASALNHPNILVIYEVGETEDTHYIVSEFIEGKTLREISKIALKIDGCFGHFHSNRQCLYRRARGAYCSPRH